MILYLPDGEPIADDKPYYQCGHCARCKKCNQYYPDKCTCNGGGKKNDGVKA